MPIGTISAPPTSVMTTAVMTLMNRVETSLRMRRVARSRVAAPIIEAMA